MLQCVELASHVLALGPTRALHRRPLAPQAARDLLARVGELGAADLGAALKQYGVKAPDTKNDISEPFPFNLMFKSVQWRRRGGALAACCCAALRCAGWPALCCAGTAGSCWVCSPPPT